MAPIIEDGRRAMISKTTVGKGRKDWSGASGSRGAGCGVESVWLTLSTIGQSGVKSRDPVT